MHRWHGKRAYFKTELKVSQHERTRKIKTSRARNLPLIMPWNNGKSWNRNFGTFASQRALPHERKHQTIHLFENTKNRRFRDVRYGFLPGIPIFENRSQLTRWEKGFRRTHLLTSAMTMLKLHISACSLNSKKKGHNRRAKKRLGLCRKKTRAVHSFRERPPKYVTRDTGWAGMAGTATVTPKLPGGWHTGWVCSEKQHVTCDIFGALSHKEP